MRTLAGITDRALDDNLSKARFDQEVRLHWTFAQQATNSLLTLTSMITRVLKPTGFVWSVFMCVVVFVHLQA